MWQMSSIAIWTFLIVTAGSLLAGDRIPFLNDLDDVGCRLSVALALSAIMTARSPATAVAIVQELHAGG